MKPQIVDDIELLVQVSLSNKEGGTPEVEAAATRIEAWLATMSDEHERLL